MKVVALGDSLTVGYGLGPGQAFPAVLEKALRDMGIDAEIGNAGVSGDTASGGADRLDWSVPEGTDAVLLELGANDALRGTDPSVTRAALTRMLERLAARRVPVLLLGMRAPRNLGPDYAAAFDAIYPDLAKRFGVALYPFFLQGVAGDAALNQADGIHPNPRGVDRVVAAMTPTIARFLEGVSNGK